MKVEVEITSEEYIKPSSPTPQHLRHLHYSFLDQLQPHSFVPLLHFYSPKPSINTSETCNILKKSLSKVLTIFYPLAGRVNNTAYIDCNDQGILFIEAKTNCQISEILRNKNPYNNSDFIPCQQLEKAGDLAAFAQVTLFKCGGLVISFSMSHKIGDGLSMFTFLQSWGAVTATGITHIIKVPPFGSTSLFPPIDFSGSDPTTQIMKENPEKVVTKLFMFDATTLSALKTKYNSSDRSRTNWSRVEALVSFIWSRFTTTIKADKNRRYRLLQAVNLRGRMEPPLPMLSFGNYAIGNVEDMNNEDDDGIVKRVADSTRNVKVEYIKMLQNKEEQSKYFKRVIEDFSREDVVTFSLSSVQYFPVYETDFGWGKPLWVATTPAPRENLALLFPTKDRLGIEAWVCLKEEDMAVFELHNYLVSSTQQNINPPFVSPNLKLPTIHSRL
ncbi:stemmadenine O-acetyltransferase-like [Euphorbia lathyris]|uniref:stemmadenine O-acetyltransferase-like n=1 Tax=Euphorbia lathyris TaxID=212925 RepID=UPI0033131B46